MVSVSKLNMSSQCVKYLMFIFNFLFVITGIILISIGSVIHGVYNEYHHFLDDSYFSVPTLLIVIGSIIFFIAFFGCCGAVKENYCMILLFAGLMIVIFFLEFSGAIAGYVLRARAYDVLNEKMMDSMAYYGRRNASPEVTITWDNLQSTFHCCGTKGPEDWLTKLSNISEVANGLPLTCCKLSRGIVGKVECTFNKNQTSPDVYNEGCIDTLTTFVRDHAVDLGGVALGIAVVQAMGVWFSIYLARAIKKSYIYM